MSEEQQPYIRLDQFLKVVDAVQSGGQAKHLIQGGEVLLNGFVETRRSKKLREGDRVELGGTTYEVHLPIG
ncbi:MAG: RNA-binding S4 domain-containing protein [Chloroflexi bacterium]|nr:RNA-binding S4 domain-containing protein [Chloroflexota bacterium]